MRDALLLGAALLSALAGIVGFFVIPVVGLVIGFVGGVFGAELVSRGDLRRAWASTVHAIKGVALSLDRPIDGAKFTQWLDMLLGSQGQNILRAKGIIDVKGENRRLVFQAVHMILEGDLQREWGAAERRWSRAVFIGRDLDEAALKAGFEACAA